MRQILDACGKLTDEQFHQRFDIGLGSLHDTTTHILGAMRWWGDLLTGRDSARDLKGRHERSSSFRSCSTRSQPICLVAQALIHWIKLSPSSAEARHSSSPEPSC